LGIIWTLFLGSASLEKGTSSIPVNNQQVYDYNCDNDETNDNDDGDDNDDNNATD
jgi:hypothetical protein